MTRMIEHVWKQTAQLANTVSNYAPVSDMTGPEALRYFAKTLLENENGNP